MSDVEITSEDFSEAQSFVVDVYPSGQIHLNLGRMSIYSVLPILQRAVTLLQSWVDTRTAVIFAVGIPTEDGEDAIYTDSPDYDEEDEDDADVEGDGDGQDV